MNVRRFKPAHRDTVSGGNAPKNDDFFKTKSWDLLVEFRTKKASILNGTKHWDGCPKISRTLASTVGTALALASSFVSSAPFRMTAPRSPVAALGAIAAISASRTLLLSRFSTANGSDFSLYRDKLTGVFLPNRLTGGGSERNHFSNTVGQEQTKSTPAYNHNHNFTSVRRQNSAIIRL